MILPDPDLEAWERPRPWRHSESLAIALISVVAMILRFHDYTRAPRLDDNQDPLQFGWAGLTLITRHVPYAWEVFTHSYHYDYVLRLNGTDYNITHPWLSHPPLFSLLVGGWAYLMGARDLADVTAAMIRPVAIILSIVSLLLAYLLARRLVGIPAALLGAAALAVSPGAVLLGREVETEALLAPLFLAALLLAHDIVTRRPSRLRVAGLLACCLLMPLVKVTGIVICGALAVVLLARGAWRVGLAVGAAGAGGLGLFALYGAAYDWHLFLAVLSEWRDLHRHGVMAGFAFITDSAGIGRGFRDGWYHLGWLGVGYVALRRPEGPAGLLVALPCVVYAAGIALLGDVLVQGRFGWYRIVLYPVLYTAAGLLAWEALRRPSPAALLLVIVLAGGTATEMVLGRQWQPNPYILAAVMGAAVIPAAVSYARSESARWRSVGQFAAAATVATILLASAATSLRLADVYRMF